MIRRRQSALAIALEIAVPLALLVAWQAWTVHAADPHFPRLTTRLTERLQRMRQSAQAAATTVPAPVPHDRKK